MQNEGIRNEFLLCHFMISLLSFLSLSLYNQYMYNFLYLLYNIK